MADFWGILNKYLVECIHFFRQCRFDIYKIISDVKMVAMESQKALRHWPLWGKFAGVRWITPHKGSVTRKMFPFEDVIMIADIFKFVYFPERKLLYVCWIFADILLVIQLTISQCGFAWCISAEEAANPDIGINVKVTQSILGAPFEVHGTPENIHGN